MKGKILIIFTGHVCIWYYVLFVCLFVCFFDERVIISLIKRIKQSKTKIRNVTLLIMSFTKLFLKVGLFVENRNPPPAPQKIDIFEVGLSPSYYSDKYLHLL